MAAEAVDATQMLATGSIDESNVASTEVGTADPVDESAHAGRKSPRRPVI
ncbi:MAG: hypothetical protein WBC44_22410 [Planctomycetaceae bacterium]